MLEKRSMTKTIRPSPIAYIGFALTALALVSAAAIPFLGLAIGIVA